MDLAELVDRARQARDEAGHPIVIGISGFCGAGKSTLARSVVSALPGAVRIRGDDFLDPARSHRRSIDWDGVERRRLVETVLEPHRSARPGVFRRFDWSTRALGPEEALPRAEVIVVDLIGLFHPEALSSIDLAVWCDVDLELAVARGTARDAALGRSHDTLWREVWVPNERDFVARFAPRDQADVHWVG